LNPETDITGLIPAAGKASRYGSNKLLENWNGLPLIIHTVRTLWSICRRIIIVTSPENSSLYEFLPFPAECSVTVNPRPERGMFSTLQTGLREITSDYLCILPGDCPYILPGTCLLLTGSCGKAADGCVPVYRGRRGHPVILSRSGYEGLTGLPVSTRLDTVLREKDLAEIPVSDPGILRDVDRPADLS
jgi:molybdenum cofactor cytidylyltransferase